jgi:hypothetical protein
MRSLMIHAEQDEAFVSDIRDLLAAKGACVRAVTETEQPAALLRAIDDSDHVLLVQSAAANASHVVAAMVERAYSKGKRPIVIRIAPLEAAAPLALFLARSPVIDAARLERAALADRVIASMRDRASATVSSEARLSSWLRVPVAAGGAVVVGLLCYGLLGIGSTTIRWPQMTVHHAMSSGAEPPRILYSISDGAIVDPNGERPMAAFAHARELAFYRLGDTGGLHDLHRIEATGLARFHDNTGLQAAIVDAAPRWLVVCFAFRNAMSGGQVALLSLYRLSQAAHRQAQHRHELGAEDTCRDAATAFVAREWPAGREPS